MHIARGIAGMAVLLTLITQIACRPAPPRIEPVVRTDPVPRDADDPAIWVHPTDPGRSLLGYVYYSDERFGIRKWQADPEHPDAARELAVFGTDGYDGDREGLAIYVQRDGGGNPTTTGYIVSSDQVEGRTRVRLYPREGAPGQPHEHMPAATLPTASDETDGLDATSRPLPGYPRGLLVMMNSARRNFLIYRWEDIDPAGVRTPPSPKP